jgi:hypothetical protein
LDFFAGLVGPEYDVGRAAEAFVDRSTENLLRVFAAGPAGRTHPALDNLAQVKLAPGGRFGGPE